MQSVSFTLPSGYIIFFFIKDIKLSSNKATTTFYSTKYQTREHKNINKQKNREKQFNKQIEQMKKMGNG